jgi:hypothetical protein
MAANAATYVVAIPANMSSDLQDKATEFFGGVFERAQPGDRLVVEDAGHLTMAVDFTFPRDLSAEPKPRARQLSTAQGAVNDAVSQESDGWIVDSLNIPALLRELGTNVLPKLKDKDVHVILVGSIVWQSPKETMGGTWSFKDKLPSDGFLTRNVGTFGIVGQENILAGALVSICSSDNIGEFPRESFRLAIVQFWGKSIVGRGGKVGAIIPYSAACVDRLFASDEDPTHYVIDPNEDVFLRTPKWILVPVR